MRLDSVLVEQAGARVRRYRLSGPLFFVAVDGFVASFDFNEKVDRVVIDLRDAWLWDSSAVAAIDRVVGKFRRYGVMVEVLGPEGESAALHDRLALHNKGVELEGC